MLGSTSDFAQTRSLKRELLAEQQASWDEDAPLSPEDLLARWPGNAQADPDVASLLFEDYRKRREHGETPSVQDYENRFPEHAASLARLHSQHAVLQSLGGSSDPAGALLSLPQVGDEVFGFRLCRELGRGAFARVFLAEQASLAGRPVVLKISAIEGSEPQTLAQLQHTHIVPIYSVHEDARAGLRAVCMPFFGGCSLSEVLRVTWEKTPAPTQGRQLVEALQSLEVPIPARHNSTSEQWTASQSPLTLLAEMSYLQAAAWIVGQLAEGLQHAHQRGILHRDIKPSNILLSSEGQPLLLDFNLAQEASTNPAQAVLGGTVAYMAPEHLQALASYSRAGPGPGSSSSGAPLASPVDHRSDIYSLGMVLYELLIGQRPFDQSGSYSAMPWMIAAMAVERSRAAPSPRQLRPDVPWGLESIVRMCLAPEQARRYQQAEHLAEDLRRFLEDRPLRFAPELSQVERLRKWTRRHPRLTSSGSVAAVAALLLLAAGAGVAGLREHLAHAEEQLTAVAARDQKQAFEAGVLQVLCLVNTTLESHDHLRAGVSACEKTLNIYGLLAGDSWQEPISWAQLAEEERHRLAEDARELLLLLAGARVRLSGGDPVVLQQALALLDRAEAIGGLEPSQALWRDRANYLEQLGENARAATARQRAESIPATSARDHYQLASTYARQGTSTGYAQAIAELNEALRLNPRHFWSCIQRGLCQQELGNLVQAAGDFGRCIGLWPEFAWSYFNRGYILDQNGQKTAAIDDYTAALERDPQFVPAYVNRGLAYLQCKQPARALADFQKAAALGKDDASLHASRGMALEALGRAAEADAAFDTAFGRAAVLPEPARLRLRWTYGFAVANRLPQKAREAFNAVLRQEPRHPQALYGRAFLAVQAEQAELALRFLDQALEADPNLVDARRTRALVLSRLGQLERASQDINWCLDHEPRQSATLYTAACVAARVAERYADAQAAEKALLLLQKALAQGAAADKVADDPDLAGLRAHPKFQQLIAQWSAARSRTESELHGDAK